MKIADTCDEEVGQRRQRRDVRLLEPVMIIFLASSLAAS